MHFKQLAGSYKTLGWILWTFGGADASAASTDSYCVMQDVKLQLLNLQWFRVLGVSFLRFKGLHFRVLSASFSRFWGLRFRSRVLRF